jgi:YggT family protein
MRARVDPSLAGIEKRVVRAGGQPAATPVWALVVYVIVAALFLAALDAAVGLLRDAALATSQGGLGILMLLIHWVFTFFRIALIVRVIASWFPQFAARPWVRWSFGATEWFLRPLRGVIPALGMIDITPIVAYFALQIAEWLIMRLLFSAG